MKAAGKTLFSLVQEIIIENKRKTKEEKFIQLIMNNGRWYDSAF